MVANEPRTSPCTAATRAGRLAKAKEFAAAAEAITTDEGPDGEFTDAVITLWIHVGIASADVICCARLGKHARGESHDEAVRLLAQTDKKAAKSLAALLSMKTRSGYSSHASLPRDRARAERAAAALLAAANAV